MHERRTCAKIAFHSAVQSKCQRCANSFGHCTGTCLCAKAETRAERTCTDPHSIRASDTERHVLSRPPSAQPAHCMQFPAMPPQIGRYAITKLRSEVSAFCNRFPHTGVRDEPSSCNTPPGSYTICIAVMFRHSQLEGDVAFGGYEKSRTHPETSALFGAYLL